MNNSQGVMICPISFFELFTSPEDYYNRWTTASLLRSLRFFGFFLTIILTPTYISVLSHHPEMLPFNVLLNLQESRGKVPFSPVLEVLFMELVIEILREAGTRMPTKIGQTIGIVGGIVIGTAAVEASLVSNILIVLVAISALLSFLSPNFVMSNASRSVRYFFICGRRHVRTIWSDDCICMAFSSLIKFNFFRYSIYDACNTKKMVGLI